MSRTSISTALRKLVIERSKNRCEYCLVPQWFTAFGCEIDHIVPEKHQGSTSEGNLALACGFCNQYKGSDIGSFLPPDFTTIVRFFHPRRDRWEDHFLLNQEMFVESKTPTGHVTITIFRMNDSERIAERRELHRLGLYP